MPGTLAVDCSPSNAHMTSIKLGWEMGQKPIVPRGCTKIATWSNCCPSLQMMTLNYPSMWPASNMCVPCMVPCWENGCNMSSCVLFSHHLSVLIRSPIKHSKLLLNDASHSLPVHRNLVSPVFVMLCSLHVKLHLTEHPPICIAIEFCCCNVLLLLSCHK